MEAIQNQTKDPLSEQKVRPPPLLRPAALARWSSFLLGTAHPVSGGSLLGVLEGLYSRL